MSEKPYGGLAVTIFGSERVSKLADQIRFDGSVTTVVSSPDLRPKDLDICLVSFGGDVLSFICLSHSGRNVATAQRRLRLSNFIELESLTLDALALEQSQREELAGILRRDARRITAPLWQALLAAIAKARPQVTDRIRSLQQQRASQPNLLSDNAKRIRAEERDSVGVAVEIFGLEKEKILTGLAREVQDPLAPLTSIPSAILREDQMLAHDWLALPEWEFLKQRPYGAAEFARPGEMLTVFNVNRTPIEQCLGVDLIYVHHRFQSFVMVQYKRLTYETGDWRFNLNEPQFQEELRRIEALREKLPKPSPPTLASDYRLGTEPCFFKFCEVKMTAPSSGELIRGMYVPADYLAVLMKTESVAGPHGGRSLTYDNVGRHFNNTEFIGIASKGWIGSRHIESAFLARVVRECIEEGHSVTFARSREMSWMEQATYDEQQAERWAERHG